MTSMLEKLLDYILMQSSLKNEIKIALLWNQSLGPTDWLQ